MSDHRHDRRLALSIVIPAYNEASRLPETLLEIDHYLGVRGIDAEVIVVDDGSEDETAVVAKRHQSAARCLTVLPLPHRGKASAVRGGVLTAQGRNILFTDADLSTPIDYADRLIAALDGGADVAIGSREGSGAVRIGEPGYRHVMGRVFNRIVQLLVVPGIDDTQCGFKAFSHDAARQIFTRTRLHIGNGPVHGPRVTGFDVEVLFIARRHGFRIVEVPVYWKHVAGSKVQPIQDSFRMFADVARVRWNAVLGRYD